MSTPKILVNLFHPDISNSRGNKILAQEVKKLSGVTFRNIYEEYPDEKIDEKKEQTLLTEHDLIVFQHPFYWYSCPPLFKHWLDKVLEFGFAYPPGTGDELKGKYWLTAITTGGPENAYRHGGYNNYTIDELLKPFEQTANLCGMVWLAPIVLHSVLPEGRAEYKSVTDEEIKLHAQKYAKFLKDFSL